MTSFENPLAIRHFQSICDNCQDLINQFHTQSDLKLFSDGYLQALRNSNTLGAKDQEKLGVSPKFELLFKTDIGVYAQILSTSDTKKSILGAHTTAS